MSCPVLEFTLYVHMKRVSCDLQNDTSLVFVGDADFVSFDLYTPWKDSVNAHRRQAKFFPRSIQENHLKVCVLPVTLSPVAILSMSCV
jgi:hypothetical protein